MTREFNVVPAGFRLTVRSWEGDGDNYNKVVLEGLTRDQCQLYVDACRVVKHCSGISDIYNPNAEERRKVEIAAQSTLTKNGVEYDDEGLSALDIFLDILHKLGLSRGDYYTRVCEEFVVEFTPNPMKFEVMTDQF